MALGYCWYYYITIGCSQLCVQSRNVGGREVRYIKETAVNKRRSCSAITGYHVMSQSVIYFNKYSVCFM